MKRNNDARSKGRTRRTAVLKARALALALNPMTKNDKDMQKVFEFGGHDLPLLLKLMDAITAKKPPAELERMAEQLRRSR